MDSLAQRRALAQALYNKPLSQTNPWAAALGGLSRMRAGDELGAVAQEQDAQDAQLAEALMRASQAQTPEDLRFVMQQMQSPELARMLAPELLKQNIGRMYAEPAEQWLTLTPEIAGVRGLPTDRVWQQSDKSGQLKALEGTGPAKAGKRESYYLGMRDGRPAMGYTDESGKEFITGFDDAPQRGSTAMDFDEWARRKDYEASLKKTAEANKPKITPKEQQTARAKMSQIAVAKQQLADLKLAADALLGKPDAQGRRKGAYSAGPFGLGKLPTEEGRSFDSAVNRLRGTITGLTRVPGVGSMSNYETQLDQSKMPDRNEYESVILEQIGGLEKLIGTIESGYLDILGDQGSVDAGGGALPPGITEDDIQETMRANNMTRQQVMDRLTNGR